MSENIFLRLIKQVFDIIKQDGFKSSILFSILRKYNKMMVDESIAETVLSRPTQDKAVEESYFSLQLDC